MRIAFLVHRFPELTETFILNQVTGLIDAGHEVDVYASRSGTSSMAHADIHRYRLRERTHYWNIPGSYLLRGIRALGLIHSNGGRRAALSLSLLYASVRFLRRQRYDVIHCQFGTLTRTATALYAIGAVSGRLVVSFRGSDLTKRTEALGYPETFQKVHLFLPVCKAFKEQLIERGCDERRIRVHHSGIKLPLFAYTERRRIGNEPIRFLTIGRLVEKKGVGYAIQAIARLKASGRYVRYTVAGDGLLRAELDRMIDGLGLRAEVQLVGPKSHGEVIALMREAHLVVAPCVTAQNGDQEGIPNVLKEAMAMGVPVISTQHSGIPELVENGVSGFLVPERDPEALADRLAYLIDHPERWPAMGRAGRERVEAEFDSDKLTKELVELYQQVMSDNPRAS
jgi:colanic acid/amylovoran biosynthesis glycosyltransferase